jgi:hypothetical protein
MPSPHATPLERAFDLARSGQCRTTEEIIRALKAEGHDAKRVVGPYLMRQLRMLMNDSVRKVGHRGSVAAPPSPGVRGRGAP